MSMTIKVIRSAGGRVDIHAQQRTLGQRVPNQVRVAVCRLRWKSLSLRVYRGGASINGVGLDLKERNRKAIKR